MIKRALKTNFYNRDFEEVLQGEDKRLERGERVKVHSIVRQTKARLLA